MHRTVLVVWATNKQMANHVDLLYILYWFWKKSTG